MRKAAEVGEDPLDLLVHMRGEGFAHRAVPALVEEVPRLSVARSVSFEAPLVMSCMNSSSALAIHAVHTSGTGLDRTRRPTPATIVSVKKEAPAM